MAASLAAATITFGIATGAFVEERDHWPTAIARARRERWRWRWLELTAVGGRPLLERCPHVSWLLEAELVGASA